MAPTHTFAGLNLNQELFRFPDTEVRKSTRIDPADLERFNLSAHDVDEALRIAKSITEAIPGAFIHDEMVAVTSENDVDAEIPCIKVQNPDSGIIFVQISSSHEDILNRPFDFSTIQQANRSLARRPIQKFDISPDSYRLASALATSLVKQEQFAENLDSLRNGVPPQPVHATLTLAGGQHEIQIVVGQEDHMEVIRRIPLASLQSSSPQAYTTTMVGEHALPLIDWSAALAERDETLTFLQSKYPDIWLRTSDEVHTTDVGSYQLHSHNPHSLDRQAHDRQAHDRQSYGPHLRIEISGAEPHIIPILGAARRYNKMTQNAAFDGEPIKELIR